MFFPVPVLSESSLSEHDIRTGRIDERHVDKLSVAVQSWVANIQMSVDDSTVDAVSSATSTSLTTNSCRNTVPSYVVAASLPSTVGATSIRQPSEWEGDNMSVDDADCSVIGEATTCQSSICSDTDHCESPPDPLTVHHVFKDYRWRSVFVPTYLRWAGTLRNPWKVKSSEAVLAIQAIFSVVFPELQQNIVPGDSIVSEMEQQLSRWRDGFGRTAVNLITKVQTQLSPVGKPTRTFQELPIHVLKNFRFLYAKVGSSAAENSGLFRSLFVLVTYSSHIRSTTGAIDVKALRVPGVGEWASDTQKYPPRGALALSATAVERGFTLWKPSDSNKRYHIASFSSSNWKGKTAQYYKSVRALKAGSLDDIVQKADTFKHAVSAVDPRACLKDV